MEAQRYDEIAETAKRQLAEERAARAAEIAELRQRIEALERKTEDVERETEAVRQRTEASNRRAEAAEQWVEAARQRAEAAEQNADLAMQLNEGKYFASLNELWTREAVPFFETDFTNMIRESCPNGDRQYAKTVVAAKNVNNVPAPAVNSSKSHNDYGDRIWPCDIFGGKDLMAPIAHLIPSVSAHASMYHDVATCALGLTPEKLTPVKLASALHTEPTDEDLSAAISKAISEAKQKAIHGAKPRRWWHHFNLAQRMGKGIGLRHSQSNKMRLHGEKSFLEDYPCVVIVPAMSLEEMKNWNGKGYHAIVMAEGWDANEHKVLIQQVCQGIRMLSVGDVANTEEIERAQKLVKNVSCGLAYSLVNNDHSRLPQESFAIMESLKSQFSQVIDDGHIFVPVATGNNALRVRKVTFGLDEGQHPPPDPFLLAVKACVVWSRRNQQQLLAGGEGREHDDQEIEENDPEDHEGGGISGSSIEISEADAHHSSVTIV